MEERLVEEIIERMALTLVLWDQDASKTFLNYLEELEGKLGVCPDIIHRMLNLLKKLAQAYEVKQDSGITARLEEGFALIRDFLGGKERIEAMEEFIESDTGVRTTTSFAMESSEIDQLPDYYDDLAFEIEDALKNIQGDLGIFSRDKDYGLIPGLVRSFHRLTGLTAMSGFPVLADTAKAGERALERLWHGEISLEKGLVDCLNSVMQLINEAVQKLPEAKEKSGFDFQWKKRGQELIERLDQGVFELPVNRTKLGKIMVENGTVTESQLQEALEQQAAEPEKRLGEILIQKKMVTREQIDLSLKEQKKQGAPHRKEVEAATTIRIDTEKLDLLLDTVGEIVIAHSLVASDQKITGLHDEKTQAKIALLTRNILSLQRVATNLRMVPIQQVFQKLSRISRDIGEKSGKEIRIQFEGEKTEIDRNIAELIYDPLVHMVRNAADHGIETPEVRQNQGKPSYGLIKVAAECRQGKVIIQITDDGKGLDKEKIRTKALEQGLVKSEQTLSEAQIYQLIFMPGLSTAAKVTEISGRGVGMDVVRSNIEKLQGTVKVDTVLGHGTTFTIRLPLTLAIVDGMVVRVGEQRYVLPLTTVREIFRPQNDQVFTIQGRGETVKLRENLYPLIRLHHRFKVPNAVENPSEGMLIVVEDEAGWAALMVDELLGKQQVVVKSMGEGFKRLKGVSGAAVLGQGNPGLILDITGILHEETVG